MGLESSWSLMDIPLDARDAAQTAARREGLSLGEWLTRRILKRYSELSVQEREEAFNELGHRVTEVSDRLDRVEGSDRSAPLREAIKKLHQGLGRLSADFIQTTGQSTIRVSALARDLEDVLGKVAEVRATASHAESAFKQHIDTVEKELNAGAQTSERRHDALAQRLDRLGQTFDDALAGISRSSGVLQSEVVRIAQDFQSLDVRLNETRHDAGERSAHITEKMEDFGFRLDRVCAATAESAASLHSRIEACREKLDNFDSIARARSAAAMERLDTVDAKVAETAADAAGMCGALDHRLLLVQQSLQALDRRHAESVDALAKGRNWVADRISEARAESSSACASLDARIAATRSALETGVAAMETRLAAMQSDSRTADLEQGLQNLTARAEAADQNFETQRKKIEALGDVSGRLDNLAAQKNQASEIFVVSRTNELAGRLDELAGRTHALETGLDLAQEHTKVVEEQLTGMDTRIAGEASRHQDALADLKSELLEEISRSLSMQIDAEMRKQEQSLEELHAAYAANTLKALDAKLEEDSHRQTVAMAAFAATPAPASPEVAFSESVAPPPVATAEPEPEHPVQDSILELTTPMADTHEPEPFPNVMPDAHDTHDAHDAPPPFAESVFAASAAMGSLNTASSDHLEPAMAFANGAAEDPAAGSASFLSAARQSLQEAAQKSETVSHPRSLLGFSPFRPSGPGNKSKNDTTSYALLAGVALVAIVAIAVTTTELVKQSHPVHAAAATASVATARHAVRHPAAKPMHAQTKEAVTKATAAPRLEQLANAGDPQAQLMLGLQEIGSNTTDAAKWLGAAAQQGMPVAQYRIATLYAQGHGVPADSAKAFQWYAAAAKGGNRKAMSDLALDYAQGSGTAKEPQQAALWFSRAAALGLVDAQFDLAVLYERGLGVPQSLIDAYRWYLVAAKAGDRESKDRVDALASQLSAQDRAAAEAAASEFKPQPMNASANEPQ